MFKCSVYCVLVACYGAAIVACESRQPEKSGFPFELIMTKLDVLEYNAMQNDKDVNERISSLSSSVANLLKSIEQLAGMAQPIIQELGSSNYTSCNTRPLLGSGIRQIQPEKPFKKPMTVLCDQKYESGGWTVIQHRFDGSTNFYRGWKEYKNGFGNLDGEFWLGLDRIHQLTASRPHQLVVLLEDYDGNKTYAKYKRFEIGDEGQNYTLKHLGDYSGTAGDSMSDLVGMMFTTLDSDNDDSSKNCAAAYSGAWWYKSCHKSNLNGKYILEEYADGMVWQSFRGYRKALKSSKMMIRPVK